jgi:hypothetical protein
VAARGPLVFRIGAIVNWVATVGAILDPVGTAVRFGQAAPNYPFLLRIWSGMAFMFGCMFWEIARDMQRKRALIKYAWIEKAIAAVSVTLGWAGGTAPGIMMLMVVFTDWIWIGPFFYYDRLMAGQASST